MANPLLSVLQADANPFSRPNTPTTHNITIGWYGLGAMGYFMARNLAKSRSTHLGAPPMLVYNRSIAKANNLVADVGASVRVAQTPEQLATECDIVFTNLANDDVVKTVYDQFAKALAESPPTRSKIFVDTSTIYPTLAGEIDKLISAFPCSHFVSSPVFGPPAGADKGTLVIVMSGDYRSKKEIAHLLVPAVGRKVTDLGGNIEKAPTLKLLGNSLILGANELVAETFTLGEKSGIGAQTVQNLLKDILPAPALIVYGEKMVNDKFDGTHGFAIDGGIKDANHIRRLTAQHNSPMPTIDIAHQRLLTARALHVAQVKDCTAPWDVLDWSAIVAGSRVAAGLEGWGSERVGGPERE